jgi:hypothetical protein
MLQILHVAQTGSEREDWERKTSGIWEKQVLVPLQPVQSETEDNRKHISRDSGTGDLCFETREIHHIPVPCSGTAKADTACPRRARRTAFSCSNSSFLRISSIIRDDGLLSS